MNLRVVRLVNRNNLGSLDIIKMIGYIDKSTPLSAYQPSQEILDITAKIQQDYSTGVDILDRSWTELNNRSVIEDENRGQLMFNAFVDTAEEDPNEAWKWRGTRSMARNKAIAMHAQITANYLLPLFTAQNEGDEVDTVFSEVMRDIIEWMALPTNSNYQASFLQAVFGMLTNPVTYLEADYYEVYQTIKKEEGGKIKKEEVLDEVLSGFKANILGSSQVLLTNVYERNIQKQRAIIKRRWIEYDEAEAKYGDHENWEFVRAGYKSIYNSEDGLFYDVKDDERLTLVSEEIYYNRREDIEIPFIGGIYLGDSDVEANPINHRDNKGNPKYNVVPFGYSRIGNHFFYFKSLMNAMSWDNMLIDAMYDISMNNEILQQEMPYAVTGSDKVDSEIIFPRAVVSFEDPNTKLQPLIPPKNTQGAFNAMQTIEQSMQEASVNDTMSGQLPQASQKAFNVAQAQANAKTLLGGVGKSLAESVIQFGDLMKDIAINHYTAPQIEELTGNKLKMKYRSFFLENTSGIDKKDKMIRFDADLIGQVLTPEQVTQRNIQLLEKELNGKKKLSDLKKSIRVINPEMFSNFKYLTKVDVEEMFTKNSEYWQGVLPNLKQILVNDPYVDQQGLTKRLLYAFFQSDSEDLIQEPQQGQPGGQPGTPGQPQGEPQAKEEANKLKAPAIAGNEII